MRLTLGMINGKAVSTSNRADADKLVNALVSMGYNKNAEGASNPKGGLKLLDLKVMITTYTFLTQ